MTKPETQLIDAFMQRHEQLKRGYIAGGMDAEAADDKATADVRREIRTGPPIKLPD